MIYYDNNTPINPDKNKKIAYADATEEQRKQWDDWQAYNSEIKMLEDSPYATRKGNGFLVSTKSQKDYDDLSDKINYNDDDTSGAGFGMTEGDSDNGTYSTFFGYKKRDNLPFELYDRDTYLNDIKNKEKALANQSAEKKTKKKAMWVRDSKTGKMVMVGGVDIPEATKAGNADSAYVQEQLSIISNRNGGNIGIFISE